MLCYLEAACDFERELKRACGVARTHPLSGKVRVKSALKIAKNLMREERGGYVEGRGRKAERQKGGLHARERHLLDARAVGARHLEQVPVTVHNLQHQGL